MSNYLAIATLTATLKNLLQIGLKDDLPGTVVTTQRPDTLNSAIKERKINIYLYQAVHSKNVGSFNPNIRRPGNGITQKQAVALDLHYLFTFYGNDIELEAQQLMALTVRTLADNGQLSYQAITDAIDTHDFLKGSNLASQQQGIKFVPNPMTQEEISRLWSVLFQTPYCLSLAYQALSVIIEGEKSGKSSLPVRSVGISLNLSRMSIAQIDILGENSVFNKGIKIDSRLIVHGKNFQSSDDIKVKIGKALLSPQKVEDTRIDLNLSRLSSSEIQTLRAGEQYLEVVKTFDTPSGTSQTISSNPLPLTICPQIVKKIQVKELDLDWQNLYSGEIVIETDLIIDARQSRFLLLNEITNEPPNDYVFAAESIEKKSNNKIVFKISGVKASRYLVRLQIDLAESPLEYDTTPGSPTENQYIFPQISIPQRESKKRD